MKFILISLLFMSQTVKAEALCDIRLGQTLGVRSIEFNSGNTVHSKIPLREMSVASLSEEMVNLQDMGVCAEKTIKKKCILKFEKRTNDNVLVLFRGEDRWLTWNLAGKVAAQKFIKILQQAGFCS
jgi:hypothetical protein